jgi:hypothetical protein
VEATIVATPLKVEIGAPINEVPLVSEHHQAPTSDLNNLSEYLAFSY